MSESFYASQLAAMAGYAFFAMLVENYISKRHTPKAEEGDSISGRRPAVDSEQAARALSYKYLVVYGVVMGKPAAVHQILVESYSRVNSGGLVTRPLRLFII